MKKNLCFITIFLTFLIPVSHLFAWSQTGHQTIALIAEKHISEETLKKVKSLLSDGESLVSISTWADEIRTRLPKTAPWHYIDLPVSQNITLDNLAAYYTNDGDPEGNLVSQINSETKLLKDPSAPLKKKKQAIRFLVHFMGDLHQPLHCSDENDRGGNEKKVRFFRPGLSRGRGRVMSLHTLWDHLLEVKEIEVPEMLSRSLDQKIGAEQMKEWQKGSVENWALESYNLAKTFIYKGLPDGAASVNLSRNYYYQMRPLVDIQLEKAGIRLALVLDNIFNP